MLSSGDIVPFELHIERDEHVALRRIVDARQRTAPRATREDERDWVMVAQTKPPRRRANFEARITEMRAVCCRKSDLASLAFTLIEVIVALVIIALGMLGAITAVSQTASNSAYLREKTLAHWVAMNRLTEDSAAEGRRPRSTRLRRGRYGRTSAGVDDECHADAGGEIRRIDVSVRPLEAKKRRRSRRVSGSTAPRSAPRRVAWADRRTGNGGDDEGEDEEDDEDERQQRPAQQPRASRTRPRSPTISRTRIRGSEQ